jgi:hypothetical protein
MAALKEMEVDTLFEIGSGRGLSGLARINGCTRNETVYTINNLRGIQRDTAERS